MQLCTATVCGAEYRSSNCRTGNTKQVSLTARGHQLQSSSTSGTTCLLALTQPAHLLALPCQLHGPAPLPGQQLCARLQDVGEANGRAGLNKHQDVTREVCDGRAWERHITTSSDVMRSMH